MLTIGERLKQLRKEKKVMQKDLAAFLEIPLRTFQSYEYNEVEPSVTILVKIADYFNVSLDYLTGRENYWQDSDGNIKVKVPADIFNLDTNELKKNHSQE